MMSSRIVTAAILVVVVIAISLVSAPRLTTFFDSQNEARTRPTIHLADLLTASYVEVELSNSRVFVLRDFDDQVYVFSVPFSDTAYWLPEFDWSHPAVPCAQFEPDNTDGRLVVDGKFRCVLPDHGEFFRYEHSWSYAGKNQGYRTADMKVAAHELTEDAVLLSNWE